MSKIKRTPLYNKHVESKGNIVEFSGYELPIEYKGISIEHEYVRTKSGLFDVSHMGEVEIKGNNATEYVQNLVTNNVKKLEDNQILYTMMCYENGSVVDDLLVYKFNENHYYLVVNASNVRKDFDWMNGLKGSYDVELFNISDSMSQVALQGPVAQNILQTLVDFDLSEIKFFYCKRDVKINGINALVSRTGYTGEDGFEIYIKNEDAEKIWDTLLLAGKENIMPIGLGARDTLRFEACLPLYGHEISDKINPLEAGLSMFVKLDNDDFCGKSALVKIKEEGLKRKLIGIEISKGIAREGYDIVVNEKVVGKITTGYKSLTLNKSIALGLIDVEYSKMGSEIGIQVRKKVITASVISKRFLKKNYKK